ncbi:MAG: hypothetical protein N2037_00695 [Acidimicrobiales bacterium]|nr:hypothetical protein [Acidimicrobiales bacterium]
METILIILVGVVAVAVIVGLAMAPLLNKKGDAAIARVKETLGADNIKVIEPKAVGFGTDPEDAGGLRGMGCLAASDTDIMFVTWAPQKEFRIKRAAVTGVGTAAEDPSAVQKTMIIIHYRDNDGRDVTAQFRLGRDLVDWLDELGYDWGPGGRPDTTSDTQDADAD